MLLRLLREAFARRAPAPDIAAKPATAPDTAPAPAHPDGLLRAAQSAHAAGRREQALALYDQALSGEPARRAPLLVNTGVLLRDLARLPESVLRLEEAVRLEPALAQAHHNLALARYDLGEIGAAEQELREAIRLKPDFQEAHSSLLCIFGLTRNADRQRVLDEHRRWAEAWADPLTARAPPHVNPPDPDRPLNIGYVSADLRDHSIAYFIEPVLAAHDRTRLRIVCYDNCPSEDAVTRRLMTHADLWRKVHAMNDDELASAIRADGIDILIDLSGHTAGNRLLALARRPAPVQAGWLGYVCTTGMRAMDWRITDAHLDPPGMSERWNTERLIRLPSSAAFQPAADSPPVNSLPALSRGFIRFGSLNNYAKIGDEVITLWATLLRRVPDARLLLVALGGDDPAVRGGVLDRFTRLGGAGLAGRIDVIGRRPMAEFLRLFHDIDIALDPFPYGGGTTSLHTLWMGVTIVTLEGESELARGTSGIMTACGLQSMVAGSREQYLDIAMNLAADHAGLARLRSGLRQRLAQSVIGDTVAVTKNLETAYRAMWRDWCARVTQGDK